MWGRIPLWNRPDEVDILRRMIITTVPGVDSGQLPPARPPDLSDILAACRAARFGGAVRCPHCNGQRTQRWGQFAGRQRYRCTGCRRTFSDLTRTPAAYSKKLPLWAPCVECMRAGMSVHQTAARVGVHPTTVFRWRHRLLSGLRASDAETLAGAVELDSTWFLHSEKGRGPVTDRAVRRRAPSDAWVPASGGVNVLIACDRAGAAVTAVVDSRNSRLIASDILDLTLRPRLHGVATIIAAQLPTGPAARFAARAGARFLDARGALEVTGHRLAHIATAREYRFRLHRWLKRFRGVATFYLENYLIWHRTVDHALRQGMPAHALRWPLTRGFG